MPSVYDSEDCDRDDIADLAVDPAPSIATSWAMRAIFPAGPSCVNRDVRANRQPRGHAAAAVVGQRAPEHEPAGREARLQLAHAAGSVTPIR